MTQYAIDPERQALVRVTTSPAAIVTCDVAMVQRVPIEVRATLARVLTILSEMLWRSYSGEASASVEELLETDSESREVQTDGAKVLQALSSPNLASSGYMLRSYIPEVEASHQVGRVLQEIDDDAVRKLVIAEVEAELAAIERAELGDFAGRSAQAVLLTRLDASPTQVAAANDLFMAEPFGSKQLIEQVDPHAASVAAAYWLLCSAEIASDVSGYDVADVIMEADNIEAIPVETPTTVLAYLDEGEGPYDVVGGLIRSAAQVAAGSIKVSALLSELSEEKMEGVDREVKLSVLDPKRPALDLLEDLLTGIHAAFLLWDEYSDEEDIPEEDAPGEEWEALAVKKRVSFANELRDRAEENRHLIGLTKH